MKTIGDCLRDIWQADATAQSLVLVATDETNRFYADGSPYWTTIEQIPVPCIVLEDFGDTRDGRASGRLDFRSYGIRIRIIGSSKSNAQDIRERFLGLVEGQLKGSASDVGLVCDYVISNRQLRRDSLGAWLWQAQMSVSVSQVRPSIV